MRKSTQILHVDQTAGKENLRVYHAPSRGENFCDKRRRATCLRFGVSGRIHFSECACFVVTLLKYVEKETKKMAALKIGRPVQQNASSTPNNASPD